MGFFGLPQKLGVPSVSAIQSYSLNGEAANTATEREVMVNTMFYAVGLACGIGPLYSLDMCPEDDQQNSMDTSLNMRDAEATSNPEAMRMQAIRKIKLFPGTPFMRGLLPEETLARIVVSAPCSEGEKQRLRTLGAFMGLNKLDAESYLKLAPSSYTPLHLRHQIWLLFVLPVESEFADAAQRSQLELAFCVVLLCESVVRQLYVPKNIV